METFLDKREIFILWHRFGFGSETHTLEQLAIKLGVTRERIRQLLNIALSKIRRALDKEAIETETERTEWTDNLIISSAAEMDMKTFVQEQVAKRTEEKAAREAKKIAAKKEQARREREHRAWLKAEELKRRQKWDQLEADRKQRESDYIAQLENQMVTGYKCPQCGSGRVADLLESDWDRMGFIVRDIICLQCKFRGIRELGPVMEYENN